MLRFTICLLVCFVLTWIRASIFQSHYFADTDLDDTVFYDTLLSELYCDSLTLCLAMCGQNCHCLGYNSQKKKCHLYKSCNSVNITYNEIGWRYYSSKLEGDGWMLYEMHYYLQIKNKVTWSNAKVECEKLGAYLVTIDTEEENTWLTETFVPVRGPGECRTWWFCCSHWIGANDIEQEGRFVWTGNNRDVTSYSNWYPNEPDNKAGQDCVHMCREGIWGDYGCDGTYSYICEKD